MNSDSMRAQNAVILCALGVASASAYLPVFMMHGVGSGAGEMANIATLAAAAHPGTVLTSLPLYEGLPAGLTDLNTQAAAVAAGGNPRVVVAALAAAVVACRTGGDDFAAVEPWGDLEGRPLPALYAE